MAVKRGGLGRGLDSLIPNKKPGIGAAPEEAAKKSGTKGTTEEKKKAKTGKNEKPAVKAAVKKVEKAPVKTKPKPETKSNTTKEPIPETAEAKTAAAAGSESESADKVVMMKISQVEPNRSQPRKEFDKEKLEELAESIRQYGVIQPLLVQKNDGYYEIIAGERRWRAAQIAGIKQVPVIIRDYTEQEVVEVSLIENIQREDLNPIEQANAYLRLMDEFHMTQENIAKRVSKSRAAITNAVRLLRLPEEIREMLIYGDLSEGHARALLAVPDPEIQIKTARTIVQNGASVRETEKIVKELLSPAVRKKREPKPANDVIYRDIEEQMKRVLGTKVSIRRKNKNAGKIEIDYYSADELERILDMIRSINT
ncbi:MAG: ParB/RepB/Spo0J family partition protein [Lachnospiraceae bacterium]|nr:ParB/RepB/Spo0J family partition protein [Lachnospiraceae bacterium]